MKLSLTLAFGCTIFLLGIPASFAMPVQTLGNALIVGGSILIGAWLIASNLASNRLR